jgi:hypothetical protein
MRTLKTIMVFVFALLILPCFVVAQKDSLNVQPKYKSSMYDPSSIYYNKGKFLINIGIGYLGYIENQIYYLYGSPYYLPNETIGPVYNASFDYGITYKSAVGLGITYQEATNSNLTMSEKARELNYGFRYTHSMGSWELFYYGFRFGISEWSYYLNNGSIPSISYTPPYDPTIQLLLGARLTFSKYVILHIEAGALAPYTVEGGITFKINTISKEQQKLSMQYHQLSHQDAVSVGLHPAN